jgi:hypothetical protein
MVRRVRVDGQPSQPQRGRVRILASLVSIKHKGGLDRGGLAALVPEKARTTTVAQAERRSDGVSCNESAPRIFRCDRRTWRVECSSASAARFILAAWSGRSRGRKKNCGDRPASRRRQLAAIHPSLRYEELRRRVLVQAGAATATSGRSFFSVEGSSPGWRTEILARRRQIHRRIGTGDATAPVLSDEIHVGMVRVLANMALAGRREMTP